MKRLFSLPRRLLIGCITLYQQTLSPDHGVFKDLYPHGYCPYETTCSEYGKQSIQKYGVLLGSLLAIKRILSCHPWTHQKRCSRS